MNNNARLSPARGVMAPRATATPWSFKATARAASAVIILYAPPYGSINTPQPPFSNTHKLIIQNQTSPFTFSLEPSFPMAPRMVTSFRRSLSFPNPPSSSSAKPRKTLHARSASLPCRSHPIIAQLRDEIAALGSWSSAESDGGRTAAWLCDGLRRLKRVHESLDDLLQLPQTRESLRGGEYSSLIEKLLEEFLRFVDVYGTFQTLVLRLKEEHSAAQISVRRKDDSRVAAHLKNLWKTAKEIGKLAASSLLSVGKLPAAPDGASYDDEAELVEVANAVLKVTVSVSTSLFTGLSNSPAFRKSPSIGLNFTKNTRTDAGIREFRQINLENLRKKTEEEMKSAAKKMQETEDCIVEIEGCAEKTFRSLINARVSLLNVLTQ